MTGNACIAVRDGRSDRHARPIELLATYGIAASPHPVGAAFGNDAPGTTWLTFERSCVPVLALLSPAWSSDALGGLASVAGKSALLDTLAALGFAVANSGVPQTIEGYVWDGAFWAATSTAAPGTSARLAMIAQHIATRLAVSRAYLRVDVDAPTGAILDATPVPGETTAIARARLAGFCPVWAAWCLAAGRRPFTAVLEIEPVREALAS